MGKFDYANSVALVTGASRGIGAAIVRELAKRSISQLILTARNHTDLKILAAELGSEYPDLRVEIIPADLSHADAPRLLKAETDRRGLTVNLLVNNAGFGSYGPFENRNLDNEQDMIQVNVTALVGLTGLYLPDMVQRGRGGILNVSSTAAFQPVPYMTTYGATKAFVQSFTEGIWLEMQDLGDDVRVVCLCPGGTETNFGNAIGETRAAFENVPHTTPEEVAIAGLDALDRGEMYRVVGGLNYAVSLTPRLCTRETSARISGAIFRPAKRRTAPRFGMSRSLLLQTVVGVAAVGAAIFALSTSRAKSSNSSGI